MKIKFNEEHIAGDGTRYERGKEYDVADGARALLWVRSGVAKAANAEARHAVAEAPVTAGGTVATGGAGKGK